MHNAIGISRHSKVANKALKRLKTLAALQVRDLPRKLEGVGKLALYQKEVK